MFALSHLILSFSHSLILSFSHSLILSFSFSHSLILSYLISSHLFSSLLFSSLLIRIHSYTLLKNLSKRSFVSFQYISAFVLFHPFASHPIFDLYPLIRRHLFSSVLISSRSYPCLYPVTYFLGIYSSSSICSHSLSSLLIPSQSHLYLFLVTSFLCFFLCFICLCLLSFSIISTHPFCIASLLISCNIVPLFILVFHLSVSPLILYHLYSCIPSSIASLPFSCNIFLGFFSCFICLCLLSVSIISTRPFSNRIPTYFL